MARYCLVACFAVVLVSAVGCTDWFGSSSNAVSRVEFDELTRKLDIVADSVEELNRSLLPPGSGSIQRNPRVSELPKTITTLAEVQRNQSTQIGQLYRQQSRQESTIADLRYHVELLAGGPNNGGSLPSIQDTVATSELRKDVDALRDLQSDHRTLLGQIAKRGDFGSSHPRLDTTNQSFRREFEQALKRTAPKRGELYLNNRTNDDMYVLVNGDYCFVPARDNRELQVPRGTARISLPGGPTEYWAIAFPDYRQALDIRY